MGRQEVYRCKHSGRNHPPVRVIKKKKLKMENKELKMIKNTCWHSGRNYLPVSIMKRKKMKNKKL